MPGAADPAANLACSGCRKKHLKCEWNPGDLDAAVRKRVPASCVRCALAGLKFYFVDETRDIETLYVDDDCAVIRDRDVAWQPPASLPSPHDEQGPLQRQVARSRVQTADETPQSRLHSYRNLDQRSLSAIPPTSGLSLANHGCPSFGQTFPLSSWREAKLMKYYLEYMCHWFDLCDTRRHFALDVPRKAMGCPTLLNAIYALTSRHLSLKEGFCDEWISHQYHEHCLRQLSSVPHDSNHLLDDDLLAATILLRTLEELEVPLLGTDNEGHLLGVQVFMNAHGSSAEVSSLRQAAYWIGLRQEVTMAVASRREIKIPLELSFVDQSFSEGDDAVWANRIVVHCARVVQFCFGGSRHWPEEYHALVGYDEGWLRNRPSTFLPIAYMEPDPVRGEVFPHILYLSHAVVIGVVHSILAQALLICHDPTLPPVGEAGDRLRESRERLLRERLLSLCGTALSNESTIPAMITASLGIATCGDRFRQDSERKALLDVLIKTEVDHAWPTGKIQSSLRRAWGWR
ncbi:hypothetical protein HIM_03757 [Hirsutella minnesotensis 3608]|uniref:Zn(2)-C6 fungal-type domain-containing protein n=1 Tax=Hirsutella minnesotensis 3608 TaxID=1043627 RepID=A0A0F7ZQ99_9HYPO|nr:hypothetical protein HIM_03757 [Hirsutella minnesotensis 3608]